MSDLRTMWTNAWRLRRRYAVLAVVTAVGTALVAAGITLGTYASPTSQDVDNSALRRITVYGGTGGQPLDQRELSQIATTASVASVHPVLQIPVGIEADRSIVTLTNLRSTQRLPIVSGSAVVAGKQEVVLPSTLDGKDTTPRVGTAIKIAFTRAVTATSGTQGQGRLEVVGTYDSSWQVDGINAVYCSLGCVVGIAAERAGVPADQFAELVGYDRAEVLAVSEAQVESLTQALQQRGLHAVSAQQELAEVPGIISLIRLVTGILFLFLLILGTVTAVGMAQALSRQRTTEAAILSTIGWTARRILTVLLGEVFIVAALSAVLGVLLGVIAGLGAGAYLAGSDQFGGLLGQSGPPSPLILLASVAAATCCVVLGAFGSLRSVSRTDVVATLRAL